MILLTRLYLGIRPRLCIWIGLEWLETDYAPAEIENHAEVPQEVAAQNAALQKAGGLVHVLEIQNRSIDSAPTVRTDGHAWKRGNLYIIGNSRGAEYFHLFLLNKLLRFFHRGRFFRKHGNRRARVDNEIQGLVNAVDVHFAAEKAAGGSAHRNVDSGTLGDIA